MIARGGRHRLCRRPADRPNTTNDYIVSLRAFSRVLDLARAERLTAYAAAYLELAIRLGVPLASKDADLCDGAERLGVSVFRAA